MATIINNPPPERDPYVEKERDSSAGVLTGILVVVLVLVLIAFVGLPLIRGTTTYNSPGAPQTGGPTYNSTSNSTSTYSSPSYYSTSSTSTNNYSTTSNKNQGTSTNYYNTNPNGTGSSPY